MINDFIVGMNTFYTDNLGEFASAFLTPLTTVIIVGTVLFLMIGSFRGMSWMENMIANEKMFYVKIGIPSVIISLVLLNAYGVL